MLEEIKKGLLSGLGAIFLTKDKIENVLRSMVDEAKITRDDAQTLKDDLLKTGEQEWSQLEDYFTAAVKKVLTSLDLCRRSELEDMKAKIIDLEKRIENNEKAE